MKYKEYLKSIEESHNVTEDIAGVADISVIKGEIGDGYSNEIYDYVKQNSEAMHANDDLYEVFNAVDNIIASKSCYERIQTVDSRMDINRGKVHIIATAKKDEAFDVQVFEMFIDDLKAYTKTKLQLEQEIEDIPLGENDMGGYDKIVLKLTLGRK